MLQDLYVSSVLFQNQSNPVASQFLCSCDINTKTIANNAASYKLQIEKVNQNLFSLCKS